MIVEIGVLEALLEFDLDGCNMVVPPSDLLNVVVKRGKHSFKHSYFWKGGHVGRTVTINLSTERAS